MKISIGAHIKDGPWGGGNLFFRNLSNFLLLNNHEVVFNLLDDDIDLILLTDPRLISESSTYTHREISLYKKLINPNVKVIHRINECDERKNTKNLNKFLIKANRVADHTIFVSYWLKKIFVESGYKHNKQTSIVYSGSDKNIFNSNNRIKWSGNEKLKFITHHWGTNTNKGFAYYKHFDQILNLVNYKDKFEFTYVGNLPKNFKLDNSKTISPLNDLQIANILKNNHVYLTASKNEPSGNHHIEGAQCGLPLVYLNNGGVAEYCEGFGVPFEDNFRDFENALNLIYENYDIYYKNMNNYIRNSQIMCEEYLNIFLKIVSKSKLQNFKKNKIKKIIFLVFTRILKMYKKIITYDFI